MPIKTPDIFPWNPNTWTGLQNFYYIIDDGVTPGTGLKITQHDIGLGGPDTVWYFGARSHGELAIGVDSTFAFASIVLTNPTGTTPRAYFPGDVVIGSGPLYFGLGSTTIAPAHFSPALGAFKTTPAAGDLEAIGDELTYSITTGVGAAKRKKVALIDYGAFTVGDLIAANTADVFGRIPAVAAGSVLKSAGTGTTPVMSTTPMSRFIYLPVQEAKLPVTNPARIDAGDQNWRLLFDATTSQSAIWQFIMPQAFGTLLSARLIFSCNTVQSGSNTATFTVAVAAITPDVDNVDINAKSFDTANSGTNNLANNQPAGYPRLITITLTNQDSVAAGDIVMIKVARDVADTATGDLELVGLSLEYQAV